MKKFKSYVKEEELKDFEEDVLGEIGRASCRERV